MEQGNASGSTSWENVDESPPLPFPHRLPEQDTRYFPHDRFPHEDRLFGRDRFATTTNDDGSPVNNDASSCVIVPIVFGVFVGMTMLFGVYAPETLQLGPSSSILIKPNHMFVNSIKVKELQQFKGAMLYGFHKTPPLDVVATWSEIHKVNLPSSTHKEWIYYFNEGSQINMSYSVTAMGSSSLVLVVAQGKEEFTMWLEDPSNSDSPLSWNIIHDNGTVQLNVQAPSMYYIGIGNLNFDVVKVWLNTSIKAFVFNTSEPYYKCIPAQGECTFKLSFLGENAAVLTCPGRKPGVVGGDCYVKVSYEPQWITYLVGLGGIVVLVILISKTWNRFRRTEQETEGEQVGARGSERNPLLFSKDENLSSGGSSYVSDTEDEEHVEASTGGFVGDEMPNRDGEYRNSSRRSCAICFNAPRNCFFMPCGHCVACFGCATRIGETTGDCPICRRCIKKVKKIYTV